MTTVDVFAMFSHGQFSSLKKQSLKADIYCLQKICKKTGAVTKLTQLKRFV